MRKQPWKKTLAYALAFSLALAGSIPFAPASQTASAAKKATVKLSKTSATIKKGSKLTLKLQKTNVKKIKSQTWSTSKKAVASVTKKGVVTGKKAGKATISVKVKYIPKGKKAAKLKLLKCKVTVKDTPKASTAPASVSTAPAASAPAITTDPANAPGPEAPAPNPEDPQQPAETPDNGAPVKYNDTSNIGPEREITIVGASSLTKDGKMTVRDNGTMRPELSSQYLIANEMGLGINLGNTMEATKAIGEIDKFTEATDFEQAWGAPLTTQDYIDAIHSYGFNTLRVPVAWTSMVSKDDDSYTINEKMLGRVEEIVNYALNDGMYVIINDHFDYGWWGAFGSPEQKVRDGAWARYEAYWTQICTRFKDYSDHLIFESANEELDISIPNGGLNSAINEDGYMVGVENGGVKGTLTEDEAYETANKINQLFVDIVRRSGGNNETRHLMIAGYTTDIDQTVDDRWEMPTDSEQNGNTKLCVSVHYYTPWEYCGDEADGSYNYGKKDREKTEEQFDKMKKFTDQGYGVIVGEMGVVNPRQGYVIKYLSETLDIIYSHGCTPVLWEIPGSYFDRKECIMQFKDVAELYNSLTGASGNTDINRKTGIPNYKIEAVDSSTLTEDKLVWSWEGTWKKNDGGNIGLTGDKITETDSSKFITTDSCTDEKCISFNDWGYMTYIKLDWSSLKKQVLRFTFKEDSEDVVGNLQLGTTRSPDNYPVDVTKYPYETWAGQGVSMDDMASTLQNLGEDSWLLISFGNSPTVTGIYVYDVGE